MGPYVEDLSTFVANSYSDIEVRVKPCYLITVYDINDFHSDGSTLVTVSEQQLLLV